MKVTFTLDFNSDDAREVRPRIRAALEETLDYIDLYTKYPYRFMAAVEDVPLTTSDHVVVSLSID